MEAQWQADRAALRDLLHTRPDITLKVMVAQIGRSYSWGKKWAKRLATPQSMMFLYCLPNPAHTTPRFPTGIPWS